MKIHSTSKLAYLTIRLTKDTLRLLRGKGKELRMRGCAMYSQGGGWYRVYANFGLLSEVESLVSWIKVRLSNQALLASRPEQRVQATHEMFKATTKRPLRVVYEVVGGHRRPKILDRCRQANQGAIEWMASCFRSQQFSQTLSDKLNQLVARFSH